MMSLSGALAPLSDCMSSPRAVTAHTFDEQMRLPMATDSREPMADSDR